LTQAPDGREARRVVPRSSHEKWEPAARDAGEILARQDESRVPGLVPIRYERMLASPFAFFRGGAAVMAGNLATTSTAGIEVQLCGDAHLSNFGVFSAPDRRLVFDCNDFDETCRGPFEWDVKRLAASVAIAARERGFSGKERRRATRSAVRSYRTAIRRFARMRTIDVWYSRLDVEPAMAALRAQLDGDRLRQVERNLSKASAKDSIRALGKLTESDNGKTRIGSEPPLLTPVEELADGAEVEARPEAVLDAYGASLTHDRRRLLDSYDYVHAARKVVGVGSVGTRAWIVLLLGRDSSTAASTCGNSGTARGRRRSSGCLRPTSRCMPASAAKPWREPTPAPVTASPSPPTWARARPSTRRWRASPRPTPTRTKETSRR